jgi:hypothetical protein
MPVGLPNGVLLEGFNVLVSKKQMFLPVLFLAGACAGSDLVKTGPDASDLTAADYRFPPVATVVVSPAVANVAVGASIKLGTIFRDAKGNQITSMMISRATWKSSNTKIATVRSDGMVTGLLDGVVTITAVTSTASGSSTVTVGKGSATTIDSTTTTPPSTSSTSSSTTTTTTVTSTDPVQNTSTGGSALSGKQFIGDDFTHYASTADLQNKITTNIGGTGTSNLIYTDGVNPQLAQLDPSVTYNGHATMKYNQPGGVASTPELWVNFPNGKTLTKMWYRVHIRFGPGFTTTGTLSNSSNAYKLLGWGWGGMDGSGRLEITNTTQYDFYWGMASRTTNAVIGGGNHSPAGNITTEWTDGAWYTYIIEVDHSTTTGVTRVYMARGSDTPTLRATTTGVMFDGSALPQLNYICLGMNFNQVRAAGQNQALWYGDWEVVDGSQYADPFSVK